MADVTPAKKNRLTIYIFIALFLGISLGFILNRQYVNTENVTIEQNEALLKKYNEQLLSLKGDTVSAAAVQIITAKKEATKAKSKATESRDKKTEPFSLLADIFLRLIKMIVAPLVFSTLVVGV